MSACAAAVGDARRGCAARRAPSSPAWTDAAVPLLGDFAATPRAARTQPWQPFTAPARREMFADWERSSRVLVGKFRADSARHIGDPEFESLILALRKSSPEFSRAWD